MVRNRLGQTLQSWTPLDAKSPGKFSSRGIHAKTTGRVCRIGARRFQISRARAWHFGLRDDPARMMCQAACESMWWISGLEDARRREIVPLE